MEKFDLESFPTSGSAKKMLSYVSDGFYDKSYVGKWIYQVIGNEYDNALEIVEDLPAQFYPETATWGLMYHEIKWGLPVRLNLPYEERRKLIYLKRDYRAPMTPYRMETYLKNATGFEVFIADIHDPGDYGFVAPHPNVFKAYFLGEGTLDSKLIHEMIDKLKQTHTTYRVNDRTELEVDNHNLEQIILRRVRFRAGISFWGYIVFDGSWLLDGSEILNAEYRYGLILGMKYRFAGIGLKENIGNGLIISKFKQYTLEEIEGKAIYSIVADSWQTLARASMALFMYIDMDFSKGEEIANAMVITKTRDFWFLDGSVLLDGSRNFNTIYRKESIE